MRATSQFVFKYITLMLFVFWAHPETKAQERTTTGALTFGIGKVSQQDTYLSPLNFKGTQFSFLRETMRMTHWASEKVSFQTLLHGAFSFSENEPKVSNYWGAHIGYDIAWHRHWKPYDPICLMAGGLLMSDIGVLYHTRNGNNPAQGRLQLQAALSLGAIYRLRIHKQTFSIRYQADIPAIGMMFCPQFGQSYYEISRGGRNHNICATHPANAFSLRQMLTLDIPIRRYALRVGYQSHLRQSLANDIRIYDRSRLFLLGFIRKFTIHQTYTQHKKELQP